MKKLLLLLLCVPLMFSCEEHVSTNEDKNYNDERNIELEGFWAIYETDEGRIGNIAYFGKDIVCLKLGRTRGRAEYYDIPGVEDCKCKGYPVANWQMTNAETITITAGGETRNFQIRNLSNDEFILMEDVSAMKFFRISKYQAIYHLSR